MRWLAVLPMLLMRAPEPPPRPQTLEELEHLEAQVEVLEQRLEARIAEHGRILARLRREAGIIENSNRE